MNEFIVLYSRLPVARLQTPRQLYDQAVRIFRAFDRDGTGTLSFDEFLDAIVILNRNMPRDDRIDFLIRQNNASGRRYGTDRISSKYGHEIFRRLNDYYGLSRDVEDRYWKAVDRRNRGYVTHQELMDFIRRQTVYNQPYY